MYSILREGGRAFFIHFHPPLPLKQHLLYELFWVKLRDYLDRWNDGWMDRWMDGWIDPTYKIVALLLVESVESHWMIVKSNVLCHDHGRSDLRRARSARRRNARSKSCRRGRLDGYTGVDPERDTYMIWLWIRVYIYTHIQCLIYIYI